MSPFGIALFASAGVFARTILPRCVNRGDISSTMWGGIYNLIIPVDDVDYARALVELFRVDFLWPASNDAAVKSVSTTSEMVE